MNYKKYAAKIEYQDDIKAFHGSVVGLRDTVTFEADSVKKLERAFKEAVDDYLEFCEERGEKPDRPYSGKIPLRVTPDIHRRAANAAASVGMPLNAWIMQTLDREAETEEARPLHEK